MVKQRFLPGFPEGAIKVGESLSILTKDGRVTYFVGSDNYYSHPEGEATSYRFIIATLMENGYVRARDLAGPPLNIPHRTLMNWGRQLRDKGANSFFQPIEPSAAPVMTPEKALECGRLLAEGQHIAAVARKVGLNDSTLRKAIQRGVVVKKK